MLNLRGNDKVWEKMGKVSGTRLKVLLVGPYPPPYGGLAVQIYEWQRYLTQVGSCECVVLNIGELRTVKITGCIPVKGPWDFVKKVSQFARQGYLVHLFTNGHNLKSWLCSLFCALAGVGHGRRTILAFGSGHAPDYVVNAGSLVRLLIRATVVLGGRLICRNERMRQALVRFGAAPHKVAIVPGFLGLNSINPAPVPVPIQAFLKDHFPVLGATVSVPKRGTLEPEYGVPLLLAGLEELRNAYPRVGLVLVGPRQDVECQINGFGSIRDQVMFTGPLPHDAVLGVMKSLTAFVRPTYFDGDSNSVREALALGVPVVASDTDYRPEGVITFRKGEVQDLVAKLEHTLNHIGEVSAKAGEGNPTNTAGRLLSLYNELVGGTDEHQQDESVAKGNVDERAER